MKACRKRCGCVADVPANDLAEGGSGEIVGQRFRRWKLDETPAEWCGE